MASEGKRTLGRWRFLVPNAITAANMMLGASSVMYSVVGVHDTAAWLILLSVLLDKLDGSSARMLKASSRFGVEFDSLADLIAFGVAPAVFVFCVLTRHPSSLATSAGILFVAIPCGFYMLCSAVRLARFNVLASTGGSPIYYGIPMPLAGALATAALLVMVKYGPSQLGYSGWAADVVVFPGLSVPYVLFKWYPLCVVLVAGLMVSPLKVPKLGLPPNKIMAAYTLVNVIITYIMVPLRMVPEFLLFVSLQYVFISLSYHLFWKSAREHKVKPFMDTLSIPPEEAG